MLQNPLATTAFLFRSETRVMAKIYRSTPVIATDNSHKSTIRIAKVQKSIDKKSNENNKQIKEIEMDRRHLWG